MEEEKVPGSEASSGGEKVVWFSLGRVTEVLGGTWGKPLLCRDRGSISNLVRKPSCKLATVPRLPNTRSRAAGDLIVRK